MQIRKFETLDEIRSIPGYIERISGVESKEPKLLGYYKFRERIHCARSECNKPHGDGYVLRTAADQVIVIGNVCGKGIFGDVWGGATYDKQIDRLQTHAALTEILSALPAHLASIDSLIYGDRGVQWLEAAELSLVKLCSQDVLQQLYLRASRRDSEIVQARERTDDDVQLGFRRDATTVTDTVDRFNGLDALAPPSPRMLLLERLRDPLRAFVALSADKLIEKPVNRRLLQSLYKSIPGALQTAGRKLAEAPLFFTTVNLRRLSHLAKSPVDRQRMGKLVWNDSKGIVEIGK